MNTRVADVQEHVLSLYVQFTPPYANNSKRAQVEFRGEGYLLRNWLRQQGAHADLIEVGESVAVLDQPTE